MSNCFSQTFLALYKGRNLADGVVLRCSIQKYRFIRLFPPDADHVVIVGYGREIGVTVG